MRGVVHALAAAYLLLLVVALAAPLGDSRARAWAARNRQLLSLKRPPSARAAAVDLAVNVVVFVPLGALAYRSARTWMRPLPAAVAVVTGSVALSTSMECVQYFVPGRFSSLPDVAMNGLGAALGVAAGWLGMLLSLSDRRVRPRPR